MKAHGENSYPQITQIFADYVNQNLNLICVHLHLSASCPAFFGF